MYPQEWWGRLVYPFSVGLRKTNNPKEEGDFSLLILFAIKALGMSN